ncbi:MAG: hypothetical protein U1B30_15145 [Pseudomonadota bacterium]|nr:hypothetical protein [Pseudomonadota bacterium]
MWVLGYIQAPATSSVIFVLFFGARENKIIVLFTDYRLVNRKTLGNNASPAANVFFNSVVIFKTLGSAICALKLCPSRVLPNWLGLVKNSHLCKNSGIFYTSKRNIPPVTP